MAADAQEPTTRPDAPILLATKLHPPTVPPQTVARERLFEQLGGSRGRPLVLVASPAGFGKSTLLAAWRERELAQRPGAWVTLDEGDNDAVVLWSHVIEALGRACPAVARALPTETVPASPLLEVVLPRLVNALAEAGPIALVLDDFHRLVDGAAVASVAWFVSRLPASAQVVVASRTDPALPLGALRARGQLLELRADALRFTVQESETFLNGLLELELSADDVGLLAARTEGWPAGVYLAALSLAGHPDKAGRVRAFDGTSAHVVDYLSHEVLAAFDADLQAFMVRTSVLERFCAPLCDALLERRDSAAALETLARSNLFLLPLDGQRRWYRFHHLFAQLLREQLERQEPEAVAGLHRRAARWHSDSGTADEAIQHAVAGGALDVAGDLIAATWVHYANAGRTSSVLGWLEQLPRELLHGDARLLLVQAWVTALRGDEPGMRAALARFDALGDPGDLAAGPLPDGFASLQSSVSTLLAAFAWGDVGAVIEHGTRSARLEAEGSPWRPVITWALGWAHYCRGELDDAERWLRETTRIAPPADQWIVGVAAIADLSLIAGMRGDVAQQVRLAEEAVALTRERGLIEAREDGEVHTAHGVALAALGRTEEALAALERGVFYRRLWAQPLDLVDGLLALAPVVAGRSDGRVASEEPTGPARADALLDEAEALLRGCADAGVLPQRLAAARQAVGDAAAAADSPADPVARLTERERTVLELLGSGMSERAIGRELFLSFNTVHTHVRSIYRKLGVSSRAEAVARGRQLERD